MEGQEILFHNMPSNNNMKEKLLGSQGDLQAVIHVPQQREVLSRYVLRLDSLLTHDFIFLFLFPWIGTILNLLNAIQGRGKR